jgi:hypothetical protein
MISVKTLENKYWLFIKIAINEEIKHMEASLHVFEKIETPSPPLHRLTTATRGTNE